MKSKILKKIAAIVLVLSMALSLSACGDTTWVMDYNGKKISSGVYLSFLVNSYAQATTRAEKPEEDIFKQKIEEKDAKVWIEENAQKLANQYMSIENKFEELGLSFSETDINELDQSFKVEWPQYQAIYEKNGVGEKSFRLISENEKKAVMIFDKYYSADGGVEPITDDNLMVHYKENFANTIVIQMSKVQPIEGEEAAAETDNKTLLADAQADVDEFNAGKKTMGEIRDEYDHSLAGTVHDDENKEDIIAQDADMRGLIKKDSSYPPDISKAIFALKPDGKATVLSDDTTYYVVARYELSEKKADFDAMRKGLLSDLKGEDFKAVSDKWTEDTKPTATNSAAVKRYSPKKVDMSQPEVAQ